MSDGLTDQERDVARLIADGHSDKEIAAAIRRSDKRVDQIKAQLARKLRLDRCRNLRTQITRAVVAGRIAA
jgi:DNA-binding NarL/FixJ family response regulator